jgi:hypothetical protein
MTINTTNNPFQATKGDLIVGRGGVSNPAILPVGTNDYVLVADSTQTTGVKWAVNTGSPSGVIQQVRTTSTLASTSANILVNGNATPQITDGDAIFNVSITPTSASSVLLVEASTSILGCTTNAGTNGAAALCLFNNLGTGALTTAFSSVGAAAGNDASSCPVIARYYMTAGTTSAINFSARYGTVNGSGYTAGTAVLGPSPAAANGTMIHTLTVTEYGIASAASPPVTTVAIQTFTTNGTYTPTAGMKYCIVEAIGGGGAGGGAITTPGASDLSMGSGGGSGEYARGVFTAANIGASKVVSIGAAGVAVSGASGGNGGNTSVGVLISANGGSGGVSSTSQGAGGAQVVRGGLGGTGGAGGSFRTPGSPGGWGLIQGGSFGTAGLGGSGQYGAGGIASLGAGGAGLGYGAGGGGTENTGSSGNNPGGNGSAGIVIITEYINA